MLKNLSIIIPSKNEAKNLEFILPKLRNFSDDIIVVDGHSNDGTENICNINNVSFRLDNGHGKGDAQRVGVSYAKYEYIIFFDADGSHDENDIEKLYQNIIQDNVDLVVCSRKTGGTKDTDGCTSWIGFIRQTGCDFLSLLFNKKYKTIFTDILYSYRAVKKKSFVNLNTKAKSFDIEINMLSQACKKKMNVLEIPSREKSRVFGYSKLNTFRGVEFIFQILLGK